MKRKSGIIMLLALITLFLAACGANDAKETSSTESSSKEKDISVTIVLKESGKEFDSKKVAVKPNTSLFDAMSNTFEVKDDDGFITAIAGKEQDTGANKYWTFTVNDKEVNVGAKEVKLKDKDTVTFDLAEMK